MSCHNRYHVSHHFSYQVISIHTSSCNLSYIISCHIFIMSLFSSKHFKYHSKPYLFIISLPFPYYFQPNRVLSIHVKPFNFISFSISCHFISHHLSYQTMFSLVPCHSIVIPTSKSIANHLEYHTSNHAISL